MLLMLMEVKLPEQKNQQAVGKKNRYPGLTPSKLVQLACTP